MLARVVEMQGQQGDMLKQMLVMQGQMVVKQDEGTATIASLLQQVLDRLPPRPRVESSVSHSSSVRGVDVAEP